MNLARGSLGAIATLGAGFVIGVGGFLRFAHEVASSNNALMLEIAARQSSGTMGGDDITGAAPVALTMLAPLVFVVATPLGWLATYLFATGLLRCLASAVDEPRGDPILEAVRRLLARWRRRRGETRARLEHEMLAGPHVSDRLARAERFEVVGFPLVIVASRPKPDWTPGTVLDCGDRLFTVGEAVERRLPVGLRTLYPLAELPAAAAIRRVVRYELPPRIE